MQTVQFLILISIESSFFPLDSISLYVVVFFFVSLCFLVTVVLI